MRTKQHLLKEDWEFYKQSHFIEQVSIYLHYLIFIFLYENSFCILCYRHLTSNTPCFFLNQPVLALHVEQSFLPCFKLFYTTYIYVKQFDPTLLPCISINCARARLKRHKLAKQISLVYSIYILSTPEGF